MVIRCLITCKVSCCVLGDGFRLFGFSVRGEKVPQVVVRWKGNQFKDCCSHSENLKWKPMHIEGGKKNKQKNPNQPKAIEFNSMLNGVFDRLGTTR